MSICLCNLSADTILELASQRETELEPASPDPSEFVADPTLAREALGDLFESLPHPMELLVGDVGRRRQTKDTACHFWKGSLPSNSVLALDEGIYVCSPEFTLLQQASQLHQANLCQMLGRYLGTWTPMKDEATGMGKRTPLTSFESLNGFLSELGHARGKNNLKLAIAYTCDGAASAPETSLQLALCLPPELHGLGLLQPTMNYEVGLSTNAKALYSHNSIRIDLCWRHKQFGLEFQGREHGDQLGEDYARWFAAREEGYELWFVAAEQLESAEQMMHIAREIANRIDLDVNEQLWPTQEGYQELLDTLAGRKHPKPVSYKDLRTQRATLRARCRTRT